MRSHGNNLPLVCAQNICSTVQGEVAYNQRLGLNPDIIDRPASLTSPQIQADAAKQIEQFEPRLKPEVVVVSVLEDGDGHAQVSVTEAIT